jgi:hypothetical protein
MLSIGTEKLLKVTLGMFHAAEHGGWLSKQVLQKEYRHDLVKMETLLRDKIRLSLQRATHRPIIEAALTAVGEDPVWEPLVAALNRYGQEGRFYYLDALADSPQKADSPASYWDEVDRVAMENDSTLSELYNDAIVDYSLFERFTFQLNSSAADSIQRWWDLISMAGIQGVLGERGKGWGHDVRMVGQQEL